MTRTILLAVAAIATLDAQVTPMDNVFAGLSARTTQLAYQQRGGDMTAIAPLMSQATNPDRVLAYRALTHASTVMNGRAWTPITNSPQDSILPFTPRSSGLAKIWLRTRRFCSTHPLRRRDPIACSSIC